MNFLQSKFWKECKKNLGNKVYDVGEYFFHTTPLPLIGKSIGYMPRPDLNKINWDELYRVAEEAGCIYITIDPDNLKSENIKLPNTFNFEKGQPIHLQENTIIDLTKPDEDLLAAMKQKHRYNLNLSKKKGIGVEISNTNHAFAEFLQLYESTVQRQGYHGRSKEYIQTVWQTLQDFETTEPQLETIATAYYQGSPLASWFLFLFEDTIFYPYGGSSEENKNVMAPYSLVWEIIQWGKQNGYKKLDLWGIKSTGKSEVGEFVYDGYSRFKVGFGGDIIEYADSINLVIDKGYYKLLKVLLNLRNKILFK